MTDTVSAIITCTAGAAGALFAFLLRFIYIGAVFDARHRHDYLVVIYQINDSVGTSFCVVASGVFITQRFANPIWVV